MKSGKVKWFDNKKGFGFITDDSSQDVFVHHTVIDGVGFKTLCEGEEVAYEDIANGSKGLKAIRVVRSEKNERVLHPA